MSPGAPGLTRRGMKMDIAGRWNRDRGKMGQALCFAERIANYELRITKEISCRWRRFVQIYAVNIAAEKVPVPIFPRVFPLFYHWPGQWCRACRVLCFFIAPAEFIAHVGSELEILCSCSAKNKEPGNIDCVNLCKSAQSVACLLAPFCGYPSYFQSSRS